MKSWFFVSKSGWRSAWKVEMQVPMHLLPLVLDVVGLGISLNVTSASKCSAFCGRHTVQTSGMKECMFRIVDGDTFV